MKPSIFTISLILFSLTVFSQTPDSIAFVQLQQQVGKLQSELKNQKNELEKQIKTVNDAIEELQTEVESEKEAIVARADRLDAQISNTRTNAEKQIAEIDKLLGKRTLWVIIGLLFAVIISGVLYLLLRRKQQEDKTDIVAQLSQTKQSIDEKLVNEFAKSTEVLEVLSQMPGSSPQFVEPDHSLALKVASEINLIERNINLMDKGTKGLKQLERSVGKLKDNLSANGYEIPELLGKQYHQGMKIIVTSSIPDENLEKGSEVITKVLIPQVNFNDKMIQTAQIEVSVGM
ncbi:MAG: hypothetical protein LBV32_11225 [Tannerellaceae bacterium]|jgi:uncharacterized membrane-anchored protein YhcB (DUF1043 family)|nr:hypothetical protein [Tannerellaceae bacterium]